jgi:oxygen-independent coproporphyrinogen-3 oxidase
MDALKKEIYKFKDTLYIKSTSFDSLYFGGGTPSILSSEYIKRITQVIFDNFNFSDDGEFSFESNPSTLTEDKIKTLKNCGMNRVSLGIQTFNDNLLKEMQCAHTSDKAKRCINLLLNHGFIVNIDMIFGLIGQTKDDFEKDLQILNSFDAPTQVTLFPLRINTHTPLGEEIYKEKGLTHKSHSERLLEFDTYAEKFMTSNQYLREESPIFYYKTGSRPHRYNSTETRVIGFGSSAGTLLDEGESSNFYDVRDYIAAVNRNRSPALSGVPLTKQQAYERFVLYRIIYMNRSVPNFHEIVQKRFFEYFGIELGDTYFKVLNDMKRMRFVKKGIGRIELTDRLWMILNKVKIGMPSIL